jgi:BCD family chlorophyll transporter-like MFS transporter
VQASAAGLSIALSGVLRDAFAAMAVHGVLGPALTGPAVGYGAVYNIELLLLFATLIAIGPLVRQLHPAVASSRFGLAEFPG